MVGFCDLVNGLRTPNLATSGAKYPKVSGGHLKNSRFWEIAAGDRVRSALRGRRIPVFSADPGGNAGIFAPALPHGGADLVGGHLADHERLRAPHENGTKPAQNEWQNASYGPPYWA